MSNQLIKKTNQEVEKVFPKTYIHNITDKKSNKTLEQILNSFNMYFLSYTGNISATRCLVPMVLRKKGLWITYVKYDGNVCTEWYAASDIDDESWGDSSNWRIGNNMLVGDITISANGNWVINGIETEFKAIGEKGNTPLIRVDNNRLQVSYDLGDTYSNVTENFIYTQFRFNSQTNTYQISYDLGSTWQDVSNNKVYYQFRTNDNKLQVSTDLGTTWKDCSEPIAAWFRWADTSGTGNVGKVQISRDNNIWEDLSPTMTNNLYIKGYVSTVGDLPTSSAAIGDIYMVGPTYDESDTTHDYPHYRMWVKQSSGWVDNGEYQSNIQISQTTGQETGITMSQKAITNAIEAETARAKAAEQAIIFDVSVYNNGVFFESISALLGNSNLDTLIPVSVRQGGMIIRFIQGSELSSDNEYVQYRFMLPTFTNSEFTNVSNWQGIDDKPTVGSENLVESGGVAQSIIDIKGIHESHEETYTGTGVKLYFPHLAIKQGDSFSFIVNGTAVWSTFRLFGGDSWGQEGAWNYSSTTNKETVYTIIAPYDIYKISCFPTITTDGTISIKLDYAGKLDTKVGFDDIVDTLKNTSILNPLSANQGHNLKSIRDYDILQNISKNALLDSFNLIDPSQIVQGYIIPDGSIADSSSYKSSGFISVNEGVTYYYRCTERNNMYILAFYDKDYNYIADSRQTSKSNITIPSGVAYMRITFRNGDTNYTLSTNDVSVIIPTFSPFIKKEFAPNTEYKNYVSVNGSLSNGETLGLSAYSNSIKKNERLIFVADITSFSGIEIGFKRYGNDAKVNRISVDNTNLTIYTYSGSGTAYAHGLTIENNIQILMETDNMYNVNVTIVSNGERFQGTYSFNRRYLDYMYAESVGSTLTNCTLSWTCTDFRKKIWMFGDSYFSYTDRWYYYLKQAGYDKNVLMDAYPGENSATSLLSLKNLLKIAKPNIIVWCLGMNDGTDGEVMPSADWLETVQELLSLAAQMNIIVVLATIPTVPTKNNERKNYYIRNTFHTQYIDFAKAVGAKSDGTWYSGMLSQDGVHPTDAGAKALYMAVVSRFPQIMLND